MSSFVRRVLVATGTLVLAVLFATSSIGRAVAADVVRDVFVTNNSDHPVPTIAEGTTNVAGTVQIGNAATAAVPTVAQGTTQVAGMVHVGNGAAHPVPVQGVDDPARNAVHLGGFASFNSVNEGTAVEFGPGGTSYAVPAGKRLVILSATATVEAPIGHDIFSNLMVGNTSVDEFGIECKKQGTFGSWDRFVCSQPVWATADAGGFVSFSVTRDTKSGGGSIFGRVDGYLIDAP